MPRLNSTVLMSDTRYFSIAQAINPYYGDSLPQPDKVHEEHTHIGNLLRTAGVAVINVPAPADSQDGVYTANWALVRGDKAVLARLPKVRKAEEAHARQMLEKLGKEVIEMPDGLRFSGQGDALPFGDFLFCGRGYRSDEAAQKFAAEQLGYTRVQLETVPEYDSKDQPVINKISDWPDSFFYDIDLSLAILRPPTDSTNGLIAYCPEAFTPESQHILESFPNTDKILISLEEAVNGFAANLISTGETVIMSSQAPRLAAAIKERGLTIQTPVITELAKGGGYIRCTTLTFNV